MNKTQILIALVILTIFSMGAVYTNLTELIDENETLNPNPKKMKDGEVRQYTKDQRLKTIVNYDQGVKHGTSYLYHDDGETVLLAMPYVKGKREGVSEKYYQDGKLYASTSYRNDRLHGSRKLYYTSGQLKAEMNYGYGNIGIGTKEYLLDGALKKMPEITTKTVGNIITLDTSIPCKDPTFYVGRLIEGQFFDPVNENIRLLTMSQGKYFINIEMYTPSYLKYQDVICSCESSQRNTIILKKRLY
ncbi:MAG: hypothetical protein RLN88_07275 [Ekhidna sp.]|uniref:toxin-antitoxin system YwqK family antitoxin n=1 Tax=Ekhidna sp. TaxID=2608089 RepID=UPI0032F001B4